MEGIRIPVKIRLLNRQRALRVRLPAVRRLIRALANRAFPAEAPFAELAVVLTDDAAMPAYKAGCFGVRAQTDVVTQAYAAVPGVCAATAELVVNAERAREEGRRRETAWLAADPAAYREILAR